ncbi:MAG: hypothetical protein KAR35_10425, partial [Candidatus Heimdallarchaeota archaeon]|nr:hypothetical protein [Candidatus Heimdallarchaeota archaeon]
GLHIIGTMRNKICTSSSKKQPKKFNEKMCKLGLHEHFSNEEKKKIVKKRREKGRKGKKGTKGC